MAGELGFDPGSCQITVASDFLSSSILCGSIVGAGQEGPRARDTTVITGRARSCLHTKTPSGFLVAALLVASGLLWAVMFVGPLAHLTHLAGGLTPFDIRPKGYSYAEARAFLEAIGDQGRAY